MKLSELEFRSSFGPLTQTNVTELEAELGTSLPDDYRNFLLTQNGGGLDKDYSFQISAGSLDGEKVLFVIFYGITSDPFDINDLRYQIIEAGAEYPEEIMPIGNDPGGNMLGMVVKGEDKGKIYFWDLDTQPIEDDEVPSYDNLNLVATSFSEFIEKLEIWTED